MLLNNNKVMKNHITFLRKKMTVVVFVMLLCMIALPSLHAQSVSPNVRVNTADYFKTHLDGGGKLIAVLNDTVYAIWQGEPTSSTSNIYFAKSIDGGASFSAEINISQGASPTLHAFPSLAVSQNGTIHIAWAATNNEPAFNVWYIKSTNGGNTFDTPIQMTTNDGAVYPAIAAHNNNVYIIYASSADFVTVDYYFTRSTNNGNTFSTPVQINDATCTGNVEFDGLTSIALDPSGNIYLAWVDGRRANGKGDIFLSKSTDGGINFGTNVMVNDINQPGADSVQFFLSIAADASNNVYVSFCDRRLGSGSANERIYMAKSSNGGNTFSSETLLAGYNEKCYFHNIAVNSTGKLYAAICASISANHGVWLYESTDGGNSFSLPIAVNDTFNCEFRDLRITIGTDDKVYALWVDKRTNFFNVYFAKTDFPTHISEANMDSKFIVYPNPTADYLTLEVKDFELSTLHFQLYDMQGKLLQTERITGNQTSITMSHLVPATYFVKVIRGNKEIKTFKIVKR